MFTFLAYLVGTWLGLASLSTRFVGCWERTSAVFLLEGGAGGGMSCLCT